MKEMYTPCTELVSHAPEIRAGGHWPPPCVLRVWELRVSLSSGTD